MDLQLGLSLRRCLVNVFFFLVNVVVVVVLTRVFITVLPENLRLNLAILFLIGFKIGVQLEDVKTFFNVQLVVETNLVSNLIFFFDQVQLLGNPGIVLELVLARLRKDFDHVLYTYANVPLVKNRTESVKDTVTRLRCLFGQKRADFSHKGHGQFHTVIRRLFKQENKDL